MGNDATLTKMMLMKFLEVAPGYAAEMQTAYADGDLETLRQVSHKLKSSVTMLANDEIAGKIKHINEYAGNSDFHSRIPELMEEFNAWFPKLHDEITKELSN
jgi:HPt (histidine-containing phosphotransfer) domain-containing protein